MALALVQNTRDGAERYRVEHPSLEAVIQARAHNDCLSRQELGLADTSTVVGARVRVCCSESASLSSALVQIPQSDVAGACGCCCHNARSATIIASTHAVRAEGNRSHSQARRCVEGDYGFISLDVVNEDWTLLVSNSDQAKCRCGLQSSDRAV